VPETPLEAYLSTVRPDAHDAVRGLAVAIEAAETGLDCRVTYRMLVYTFSQRWHQWVVAVGVSKSTVNLRFLYGSELDDHAGILRAGTSTASQADFTTEDVIDGQLVSAYVREAVAKHPNKPQRRPVRAR
jgi:hypothetical protein